MKEIRVSLGKRSYNILVGSGALKNLGDKIVSLGLGEDAFVITNPVIKRHYAKELIRVFKKSGINSRLEIIPEGETAKDFKFAESIMHDLSRFDLKKRVFIVALGGGVIGDLSGFVASIYRRGIPYIQVPTTLLSQVDSSIGGKTAVDLKEGKNLVGAFYQPRLVLCDIKFLKTLTVKQLSAGLAEVVKYALIADKKLFAYLERNYKEILSLREKDLYFIVGKCARIKANIVSLDEKEERQLRTKLNFGHTIGHAIESASEYKYNHGESIALGMLVSLKISEEMGLIGCDIFNRVKALIRDCALPCAIKGVSLEDILKCHYKDKKFTGSRNKFVLCCGLGKTKIVCNIPLSVIKGAIKELLC